MHERIQRAGVVSGYLAIFVLAVHQAHSTSGWVLLSLAPALWLDRHVFQLARWPGAVRLLPAILLRLVLVLLGALYCRRLGGAAVTWAEAGYLGYIFSASMFLLEVVVDLALRWVNGGSVPAGQGLRLRNLVVILLLLAPIALIAPLNVFHPVSTRPTLTPAQQGLRRRPHHHGRWPGTARLADPASPAARQRAVLSRPRRQSPACLRGA